MNNSIEFLAKIKSHNINKYLITLEVSLTSEESYFKIMELLEDGDFRNFKLVDKKRKYKPLTDSQLKYWFVCVKKILEWKNIYVDQQNIRALHDALKKKYFPIDYIEVGGVSIPTKHSITDLTKEEMMQALDSLISDYGQLGLNLESR